MKAKPEKALVFAAGLGTRMRPITLTLPKPLVRVGGRTMLDHMLDRLEESGVADVIVNVHWLADQIEDNLRDRTSPRIKISDEREELLDQGGGIVKALDEFDGKPFFICNTDALWIGEHEPQIARLARAWDGAKMDVLLLLAETRTSVGVDWRGDFFADAQGRLRRPEPGEAAPYVYSGVGIIKSSLFAGRPLKPFRLAPFFFAAGEQGRLFGLPLEGRWLHVGDPEAMEQAEKIYASAATV